MALLETLIVHVVDEKGRPVTGAFVTVEWGTAATPEITLLTNAEGRAHLGVPHGRFLIRAAVPGGSEGTSEVDVPRKVEGDNRQISANRMIA